MKSNIFIPERINVGFRERNDTYTKKLAYIIYFDEKGTLRKETSWNSWRDKKIDNEIYENVPTSGFVLNKKAGGYSTGWNHRQTYVRVYDSRGFEFEITVPNLLYILENATSTKGKGIEGDFIYGWDGKDLVLIPTESPDYIELSNFNEKVHNQVKLKGKDLKSGATYLTKDNNQIIYLGRFDEWDYDYVYEETGFGRKWTGKKLWKTKKKAYFFANNEGHISTVQSLSKTIIDVLSEECVENYADLMDKLEHNSTYFPIDDNKDEYVDYTFEEFKTKAEKSWWSLDFYINNDGTEKKVHYDKRMDYTQGIYEEVDEEYEDRSGWRPVVRTKRNKNYFNSLEEVFNLYHPKYLRKYLANGKLYSEGK
jgi:hypothetical protein